jgi:hypothetical protein
MEGSMQPNVIAVRTWTRETDAAAASASFEGVILFSLLGLAVSAVVLLASSAEAISTINAALMLM